MPDRNETPPSVDPFDLNRFLLAQNDMYDRALAEIRNGRKQSHWMWFIFPQFWGLGASEVSQQYAIRSLSEARAYLEHPVLGTRLRKCAAELLALDRKSAFEILGTPDDLKLQSCATLFAKVAEPESCFKLLLNKYYAGVEDPRTLERIR
jgi:uncharacterized protein (DUF1810 family)